MTEALMLILAIELGIIILGAVGIFSLEAYALYIRSQQDKEAPLFKIPLSMLGDPHAHPTTKASDVVPVSDNGQYL